MSLLIVTAVEAEAQAVRTAFASRPGPTVIAGGVGPTAAAAATARAIALAEAAQRPFRAVINAGVAGAFAGRAHIGDVMIATACVAAELGVTLPDRHQPLDELGFGTNRLTCSGELTKALEGRRGQFLTLAAITGSPELAASLADRYPDALGEAMEGFGVAQAADAVGLPFAEVRTVSNLVGDRDVAGWDWEAAFASLTKAFQTYPEVADAH
ncbi:futalosine hydrolase [Natronoglycomyces albus]|uniref:Futalosine hydrolase n=1 Tax=Natronoglycomyces albus TaxID=2811108 RepID=A0A895XT83_9ACTN|nr:futalosine hydrolase [Natronoglycomyces albus]QSB05470.1 futalosine hydrolase [Natronoglycomyces albus]